MKHILLVIFVGLWLNAKLYASCCSSASSGGVPRLLPHERALIELGSAARYTYGSFDQNSSFHLGHDGENPHIFFDEELLIMARLIEQCQPFVRIPARIQTNQRAVGAGFGDISFGARIPLLSESAYRYVPGLAVLSTARAPTGISARRNPHIQNVDIIGQGSWLITTGIVVEKTIHPITYGLGYNLGFDPDFRPAAKVSGLTHTPFATVGFPLHDQGAVNLSLAATVQTAITINKHVVANTDKRKLSLQAGYSHTLHSHVKLLASIGFDTPIPFVSKNGASEIFLRLGMRLGVF